MSRRRYELSDFEWSVIEPLLPNKPRGVPRDVQMVDSSSIRVHRHAPNGKRGVRRMPPGTTLTPDAWGARAAG